jgi:hypothetical protein
LILKNRLKETSKDFISTATSGLIPGRDRDAKGLESECDDASDTETDRLEDVLGNNVVVYRGNSFRVVQLAEESLELTLYIGDNGDFDDSIPDQNEYSFIEAYLGVGNEEGTL